MYDLNQIISSVNIIEKEWNSLNIEPGLILLHCVSAYPTPLEKSNLLAIKTLSKLGYLVGYSDHTLGMESAILSVGLGVKIIEKHFTISKNHSSFRDHKLSLEPNELKIFVKELKKQKIMGQKEKQVLDIELETFSNARRSICASKLSIGKIATLNDLICLRPSGGLEPGLEQSLMGKN